VDRDTAVVRIQDGLGFRTDLAPKIVLRLQEAQRDLERGKTLPYFLLSENQSLTLTANSNSIALPTDFLRRAPLVPRFTVTGQSFPQFLHWKDYTDGLESYYTARTGAPQIAVLRKSTILVFPTPSTGYTVTWDYYKRASLLTTNITNDWLDDNYAPEALIGEAGVRMARDLRNKEAVELFTAMRNSAWMSLFKETILQEVDTIDYRMGANN